MKQARRYREAQKQRSRRAGNRQIVAVLSGAFAIGILAAIVSVGLERPFVSTWRAITEDRSVRESRERSAYYSGCNDAEAAGAAPIYAGEPGYRSAMDGDGDGIACEPYPR
ncbi:excalibur calcium-binding domain-containing protein [Sphingomonas sp. A2-49]|nr:excalibur calcium-binding domain-containing protein [Sphingomonas sp. A2-49]